MNDEDLACLHHILRERNPDDLISVSGYYCYIKEILKVIEQAQAYRLLNKGNPCGSTGA